MNSKLRIMNYELKIMNQCRLDKDSHTEYTD